MIEILEIVGFDGNTEFIIPPKGSAAQNQERRGRPYYDYAPVQY
jgi:hypothetical protein